ncbi:cytochrome p450, partial [Trifolium pratense]
MSSDKISAAAASCTMPTNLRIVQIEEQMRIRGTYCLDVRKARIVGLSKENKEVAGRMAMMVWLIWNNRNQWLWNQEKRTATQLGIQASHMWNAWFEAQRIHNSSMINEQVQHVYQWIPPRQGWLKWNVDAGFHNDGRITSGGWCIRDDDELFRRAGTYWISSAYSILEAKALVLLEAMKDASNMNLENIIFETDSSTVVAALHANHVGVSPFSPELRAALALLCIGKNTLPENILISLEDSEQCKEAKSNYLVHVGDFPMRTDSPVQAE